MTVPHRSAPSCRVTGRFAVACVRLGSRVERVARSADANDWWGALIVDLFVALFGNLVEGGSVAEWQGRAKRARAAGKVLGTLRVRAGSAPGLSEHRLPVEVTCSLAGISYEAWHLHVTDIHRSAEPTSSSDTAQLRELNPVILKVRSGASQIDWAVAEQDVEYVLSTIRPE